MGFSPLASPLLAFLELDVSFFLNYQHLSVFLLRIFLSMFDDSRRLHRVGILIVVLSVVKFGVSILKRKIVIKLALLGKYLALQALDASGVFQVFIVIVLIKFWRMTPIL